MAEPTSALTFRDLVIEVAQKLGTANYGLDGLGVIGTPTDTRDLNEAMRLVNSGVRMFLQDAPAPNGWRFARPTASLSVWGTVGENASNTLAFASYDAGADKSTLNSTLETFYSTMEEKPLVVTGGTTLTVSDVVSATQIKVYGDASAVTGDTFRITADGNYTLPRSFGGMYPGAITYAANTNQGVGIGWSDETTIRKWRENVTDETGDPFWAAVRVMATGTPRRRWELMLYPSPDEVLVVEFPFTLHFDSMVDLDEVPPVPFSHDEAVKAAVRAKVEMEVEDRLGPDAEYYRTVCLPNSHRIDAQSAPKSLGYFGNPRRLGGHPTQYFRDYVYQRPGVTFNP